MTNIKREKEEQLALANMLSKAILSTSNISDVAEGFAKELKRFMSIDWGTIAWIERGDTVCFLPLSGKISLPSDFESTLPLEGTPIAWLAENKRALLEPDLAKASQPWTASFLSKLGKQEIRSMVLMPLFSGGEVFGSLIVGSRKPNAYRERELKLLKYAASQLALPLANSLALQQERSALAEDFRTPLTPVIASSGLLAEELQGEPESAEAKLSQNIYRGAQELQARLSKLVEAGRTRQGT
jgi:GAF domain-containing protein